MKYNNNVYIISPMDAYFLVSKKMKNKNNEEKSKVKYIKYAKDSFHHRENLFFPL
jgi:hypothetical protein